MASKLLADLRRDIKAAASVGRYVDMGMRVRRLTIVADDGKRPAPGPCVSSDGQAWAIPAASCDDKVPISTRPIQAARKYETGTEIFRDGKRLGVLVVDDIATGGGVWDALYNQWSNGSDGKRLPPQRPVVFDLRESQVPAFRTFAAWLAKWRRKEPTIDGLIAFGGRRSGKTVVGLLGCLFAAVDVGRVDGTPLIAWLVSCNHPAREELDRELRALLQPGWAVYREMAGVSSPAHTYTLLNGAQIMHKTAEDPEALRVGRCDIALQNEAGKQTHLAFANIVNAQADKSGFWIGASNRPRRSKANWIALLSKEQKKLGPDASFPFFELDPKLNDAIDQNKRQRVLDTLRRLDPDDADEGALLEAGNYAYAPPWDELEHVKPMPQVGLPDLTREVTRKIAGVERDYIIGCDFQGRPAMVASVWKVVGKLPGEWHLWCVKSYFVEATDEEGLIDEIAGDGFSPENSLIIGDASGQWQKGDHGRGPVSFRFFRDRRYVIVGAQRKKGTSGMYSCNPRPKEAAVGRVVGLLTKRRANGYPAIVVDPEALTMGESFAKCKSGRGRFGIIPVGDHSHLTDTATYVAWAVLTELQTAETKAKAGTTQPRQSLREMGGGARHPPSVGWMGRS